MNKKMSRRTFLGASGLVLTTSGLMNVPASGYATEGRLFAYVGRQCSAVGSMGAPPPPPGPMGSASTLGSPEGGGIDVFRVNMADGSLELVSSTGPEVADLNSDGICASADGRFVYCVNRTPALGGIPGTGGGVYAFAIDRRDGSLRHLNTRPSMGSMPASVCIDTTNSRVVVGNHGVTARVAVVTKKNGVPVIERPTDSATVALFPVNVDGSLEAASDAAVFADQPAPGDENLPSRSLSAPLGPEAGFQIGPSCHAAVFDRTQRWVIASDNGYDHLYVYRFSPTSRLLEDGKRYPLPPGRSPRHFAVHPRAPYFFITNESQPSVSAFHFDSSTGVPRLLQTIATIPGGDTAAPPVATAGSGSPAGFGKGVSPSDIRLHPNGKFLYSSNRASQGAEDTIAVFAVDEVTGHLTMVDLVETGGSGQREFDIEPSGRYLFSCNPGSDDVISYAVDGDTGRLTQTARIEVPRVSVITFATL
ncbi:lactonase family protein [Nocardia sp. NPDC055165]